MKWLPFSYKNTLSPWFKEKDLEKGWELLSAGLVTTLFFRNFGGGLFADETSQGTAMIGFVKVSGIVRNLKSIGFTVPAVPTNKLAVIIAVIWLQSQFPCWRKGSKGKRCNPFHFLLKIPSGLISPPICTMNMIPLMVKGPCLFISNLMREK